jgi:hypothetical protein
LGTGNKVGVSGTFNMEPSWGSNPDEGFLFSSHNKTNLSCGKEENTNIEDYHTFDKFGDTVFSI